MGIDYEHELGNGWNRWQKLVLTELQRISKVQEDLGDKIDPIILQAALTQQAFEELKHRFESDLATAEKLHEDHEQRLRVVESSENRGKGVRRYKEWIVPLIATIMINLITWWLFISSSHPAPHLPSFGG